MRDVDDLIWYDGVCIVDVDVVEGDGGDVLWVNFVCGCCGGVGIYVRGGDEGAYLWCG